ncbi:MAG: ABC transporter permease [Armatimonadetes bacterium]|nr:ABC transporter permease [Armatimonadota bacterium]
MKQPGFRLRREHGLLVLLLGTMLLLSTTVEYFLTPQNLLLVLRDQAHLGILAAGMTLVILTGGIDLSVGSATALAGMALGLAWQGTHSLVAALLAALGVGLGAGAVNGALVTGGRIPPLIVTLATLSMYRGAAYALGGSAGIGGFPAGLLAWSRADWLGFPAPAWLALTIWVTVGLFLARTPGGRALYALGAAPAAARLSGLPVSRLLVGVYALNGLLAGAAAIIYAARNNSVKPDIGLDYELLVITMVVLGGVRVTGGEGTVAGTVLGFLTLTAIQRGITLRGLPAELHGLVVAGLLVGALWLDSRIGLHAARAAPIGERTTERRGGAG